MSWLVGQWSGAGVGDALALQSWLRPTGRSSPAVSRHPDSAMLIETSQCLMDLNGSADARRSEYLEAVLAERKERPDLVESIRISDAAFIAYRDTECGAVYQDWIDGSIAGRWRLNAGST